MTSPPAARSPSSAPEPAFKSTVPIALTLESGASITGGNITNLGLIEVAAEVPMAATVADLYNTIVNNCGGTIEATGAGATVVLGQVTVNDGTLETSDGGVINTYGNSTFNDVTIALGSDVQVGPVPQFPITTLTLQGTIDNQGTIAVGAASGTADLVIDGAVTIEGTDGAVTLDGSSGNAIVGALTGADTLDNESTISGVGTIGAGDGFLTLDNQLGGVIDADIQRRHARHRH